MMKCVGNNKLNEIFESNVPPCAHAPSGLMTHEWRSFHIRSKYADRMYFKPSYGRQEGLSEVGKDALALFS